MVSRRPALFTMDNMIHPKTLLLFFLVGVLGIFQCKGELTCPDGWDLYYQGKTCISLITTSYNWFDARKNCQSLGGDLLRIKSVAKNRFIMEPAPTLHSAVLLGNKQICQIQDFHKKHRSIGWIGYHRQKNNINRFIWLDDPYISRGFTYWSSGEPNGGSHERCVSLGSWRSNWNDFACNEKVSSVCEMDAFHAAPLVCPTGWRLYNKQCYRFYGIPKTWNDAKAFCETKNSHLAAIPDKSTDNFIYRNLWRKRSLSVWIGMNDIKKEGVWRWTDGKSTPRYRNWASGEPNNYHSREDCGHYWKSHHGQWADSNCLAKYYFLCQAPAANADIHCGSGWDLNMKYKTCTKRILSLETWDSARASCKKLGGDLIKIPDSTFNRYVDGRLGNNYYWIGLHEQPNSPNLFWLDEKTKATYTHFGATVPRAVGKQNCCLISRKDVTTWSQNDCLSKHYYMCQKQPYASISCPAGYKVFRQGKTCVRLSTDAKEWEIARATCQKDGSDLVTISNSAMNSFVMGLIASSKGTFWIGLNDRHKEKDFHWLDTTSTLGFTYWSHSQPNDTDGSQNCILINGLTNNRWWDDDCVIQRRYICEQPAAINGIKTAVINPVLMCPKGWSYYVHGKTCIKFNSDVRTMSNARTHCQAQGADLIKIADKDFSSFVNNQLKKTGTKLSPYIGLSAVGNAKHFRWLDEKTDAIYTNWRSGSTIGRSGNCAVINVASGQNYVWNDVSCSTKRAYICQMDAQPPNSVNCGSGWTDSPDSDYCYRFNSELLTWNEARSSCKLHGGDLSSVVNSGEMLFLEGRLHGMYGDKYWSGGNDIAVFKGWTWSDNKPFAFFNWDSGPPPRNRSENCIAINRATGRWSVELCLSHMRSICKKLGNVINHPTPTPTSPPKNIPSNKVWGCPPNWPSFRGSCYHLIHSKAGVTWQGAQTLCHKKGANLASIVDGSENKYVFSLIPKRAGSAWIGFNSMKRTFSYSWSDGVTPMTYTNWNVGEPNHFSDYELCGQMIYNGLWDDNDCRSLHNYMICKQNKKLIDKSVFQKTKGCKQGGFGYQDKCYKIFYYKKNFADGQKHCKSMGGNLATANDRYIQSRLSAEIPRRTSVTSYWIGLSNTQKAKTGNNYVYAWKSGAKLSVTNWDRKHTGAESGMCVGMVAAPVKGLWHSYPCSNTMGFICEYPRPGFTTPKPVTTVDSLLPCPSGWIAISHMCYKAIKSYTDKKSWMDAEAACRSSVMGGTLASLTSTSLSDTLARQILKNDFSDIFWIGLNDRALEGGYSWMDGQPFVVTNWAVGEPNNKNNGEDCVEWYVSEHQDSWNDNSCYTKRNYICQAPRGAQLLTTMTAPSVGPTTSQCGKGEWYMYNNYCYFVGSDWISRVTWFEAKDKCHSKGGHLVSIANHDENDFVAGLINKKSTSDFWIGLNDFDEDKFKWEDGTTAFYYHFQTGEPNDGAGGERCVVMTSNGAWNDLFCGNDRYFVCKKKPGNSSPITETTKMPTGGCPNHFQGIKGTSRCYHLGGVNVADRKSFTDAAAACKAIYPKSRLASIHSLTDEEFVATLIAGLNTSAWVGLKSRGYYSSDEKNYKWVDNTQKDYAQWAPLEPHSVKYSKPQENCVDMMIKPKNAGEWMNTKCGDRLPYICEFRKDTHYNLNQPNTQGCNTGYQRFRNSCYKYVDTLQTWSQSEATCAKDGGHLVSIQDQFESAFVDLQLTSMSQPEVWIGLANNSNKNTFSWSDGWPLFQTNWDKAQPDLFKQCVVQLSGTAWSTASCSMLLPSLCKIDKDPAPLPTASVPGKCPGNQIWTQLGENCYFVESTNFKSWPEASHMCKLMGADLASIHSPSETRGISMFVGVDVLDAWIGFSRTGLGSFVWSDQSVVETWNWAYGSPSVANGSTTETCVLVQGMNGKWTDTDCFSKHGYICKVKQIPLTTSTQSTTSTTSTNPTSTSTSTSTSTTVPSKATKKKSIPASPSTTISPGSFVSKQGMSNQKQPSPQKSQSKSSGLSGGADAGIAIGCVAVIGVGVIAAVFVKKRRGKTTLISSPVTGYDNAVYNVEDSGSPGVHFSQDADC